MRCTVLRCKSDSGTKIPDVSFHSFPEDDNLRRNWILATGRTDWTPRPASKICSRHFDKRFLFKKKKLTLLLPNAVPVLESKACTPSSSSISLHEETNMEIEYNLSILTPDPVLVQSMVPSAAAEQAARTGRPRLVAPIKVTSGPSLKCQANIAVGSVFYPVITDIKSEADLIKQEEEDPQSDDTLSLANDADQPSDADQPGEDLMPLSNAQVPLSNAPDPLSEVKVEEMEIGVDEVQATRPVEETRPVELTTPVELTRSVEETKPVELTRAVDEPTVPLPLHLRQELSRAGNDCYNLIRTQANQINKLSVRCGKQRLKLHSYVQLVRRRDMRISSLHAELEALRGFIGECGCKASGGEINVRRIQIRSSNTVVGQKKPNRQLLIVKRDYKPPKSSVSAQHTSDTQTSPDGAKGAADILLKSFVDGPHTSDNRRQSSVGVKRTTDIQGKSSVSSPGTPDVLQKSTAGVKRTLDTRQELSVSIPATSNVLQKSTAGVKRTLDTRQELSVSIPATSNVLQKSTAGVKRTLDTRQELSVSIPATSNVLQKSTVGVKRTLNTRQELSVSIPVTSNVLQKSTVGVNRTLHSRQELSVSIPVTSDGLQKSTVGIKRTLDIRQKSSLGIPSTSNVRQKSSTGVKYTSDIKNNPSIAVQPVSVVPQTSVGFQRTSDVRQNTLVIQIDGMHNTVLQPKLVRLDGNSMETG